jgi:hypothetical protein
VTFERQPYMIRGVSISEYMGNRQYSLKGNFLARPLKYHNLRRYIKEMDNIEFANPDSNKKRRSPISNLNELTTSMDEIHEKGTWS